MSRDSVLKGTVKFLCTIIIVILIVDACYNAYCAWNVVYNTQEEKIPQHKCTYTYVEEYTVEAVGDSGIKCIRLRTSKPTADKRISNTDYHTLINSWEYTEDSIVTQMKKYINEQQQRGKQTTSTIHYKILAEDACIGYYKYTKTMQAGNSSYIVPIVNIIHIQQHSDGLLQKTILEMNPQVYNGLTSVAVLQDYLGWVGANVSITDILSVTDETGTYIPEVVFTYTPEDYFEFDSTTGTITAYRINDKDAPQNVYIPETIGGVTVQHIGEKAFYKYYETERDVETVVLPDTVITIGAQAFMGCDSLKSIDLSDKLQTIGASAFAGCSSLTIVTIPNSVTELSVACFKGATALKEVKNTTQINTYYSNTFEGCSSLTEVQFDKNVLCFEV